MSAPRKSHVIQTTYFDILYSDLSQYTASLLAKEADALYERAKDYFGVEKTFRMPIIISPDSDRLEVYYSPGPYNRIVVYEGVPNENQIYTDNALLQLFYEQVLLAINESIRSPLAEFLHTVISSDSIQPIVLLNMPFSFLESSANEHMLDDHVSLQILSQAKLEGEFPTWFQISAMRDIEPGDKLAIAAGTAFTAYIQQRWGFAKYAEFWNECSKLNLLFTTGNFYKVYKVSLDSVWNDFKDSIPLPDSLRKRPELEESKIPFFWNDKESRYDFILASDYGLIWYDDVRHEVDIFDYNSPIKTRMLLFLGDSIEKMTLSPDGRYLSVSFNEYRKRENFILKLTKIFDLKEREYVGEPVYVRDGAIVLLEDGSYALAGVSVKNKYPELQVYKFDEDWNSQLIFTKSYDYNTIPLSLAYAGPGKVSFLMSQNKQKTLCQLNYTNNTEKNWNPGNIKIENLKYSGNPHKRYTFQYVPEDGNAFTRMGFIELSDFFEPKKVYLQNCDLEGGVYSPVFVKDYLYYSSHKLYYDEFITFPLKLLPFVETSFEEDSVENKLFVATVPDLQQYQVKKYNPLKYWSGGTTYPMLGAVDVDLDDGVKLWPGLGFTYKTQSDPFKSTDMTFSGVYKFANLEFSAGDEVEKDESLNQLYEQELKEFEIPSHRDFSFTAYLKNTSTPVDVEGAAIFDFVPEGRYDFSWMAGTAWSIPLGLNFRKLRINLQSENTYSTDYYDSSYEAQYPAKCNWVNPVDSYQTFTVIAKAEYENLNQYGLSTFEQRGFKIGTKIYSFWDMEKVNEYRKQKEESLANKNEDDIDDGTSDFLNEITQLNVGLNALVAIPRMTPLQMNNGWVLSVPGTLSLELMGQKGTALETYGEMLLLGKEIQNGFPFLYLYFNRCGLKLGYNLALRYNLGENPIPDLRSITDFYDIFANTYPFDNVYLKFDMDFVTPIGRLSTIIFKSEFKAAYYIRLNKFKFNVNIDIIL